MSYPIMIAIPISMAKGLSKTPNFNAVGQKNAASMGNSFVSLKPYPTWDFELDMDHVTGNEANANSVISSFMGIYMACQGQANLFLFTDPQDNFVSAMQFGVGDSTTTKFQLSRGIGGATDIIQNLNGAPQIFINGVLTSAYTISTTGVVTFTSAPGAAAVLTWTGNFYFLCRFSEDMLGSVRSFSVNNGIDQWNVSSVKFSSEFVSGATTGVVFAGGGSYGTFLTGTPLAVLLNPTNSQTIVGYPLLLTGLESQTANIATAGFISMANTDTIDWRNHANTGNLALGVNTSNQLTFNGTPIVGSSGTVTSVALADSTGLFTITGSPITTSGTLTLSAFASQTANTFLAAPNGSSGAPTFRTIAVADVPTLNQNSTGTSGGLSGTPNITVGTVGATTITCTALTVGTGGSAGTAITLLDSSTLNAAAVFDSPTLNGQTESAAIYCKPPITGSGTPYWAAFYEVPSTQPDGVGGAIKINHYGAGDAIYIPSYTNGGAAIECASFIDGTKGFISTIQTGFTPFYSTCFNALWANSSVPGYGMYLADQAPGMAFTAKQFTGITDSNQPMFAVVNPSLVYLGGIDTFGNYLSGTANPATAGKVRLASGDAIEWRNAANTANITLSKNASDGLVLPNNSTATTQSAGNNSTDIATTAYVDRISAATILTTKGDIIIENATPTPVRLAIGTTGQVLTVASGLPSWATPSGGSSAFSALTSSTNTTAAMVVGTGASLTVSGSGTIAATSVPFSGVSAATNTVALVIGSSGSLTVSGTGTIAATGLISATTTVSVSAATAPTVGQVLTATSGTAATWQTPSGGSSAFSAITGSTNTTAAMVVGTGASLTVSGTGSIFATNGNALVNVKVKGAVGNSSTNDNTALQAAFTAVSSANPGVYFPANASSNTYVNNTALTDPTTGDLQFLFGEGDLSGLSTAGSNNLITLSHFSDNNSIAGGRIQNLSLSNSVGATPTSIGSQTLLSITNANSNSSGGDVSGLQLNNVQLISSLGPGMTINQPILNNIQNVTVFGSAQGITYTNAGTTVTETSTYMNTCLAQGRVFNGQQAIALVGIAGDNCGTHTDFVAATCIGMLGVDGEAGTAWQQSITTVALTSNVATITVPNTYAVGDTALITGGASTNAPLNGRWKVATRSSSQFTFATSSVSNITSNSPAGMKSAVECGDILRMRKASLGLVVDGIQMFTPTIPQSGLYLVDGTSGFTTIGGYINNSAGVTNDVSIMPGAGSHFFHSCNFGAATEANAIFAVGIQANNAGGGANYVGINNTFGAGNIIPPIAIHVVAAGNPTHATGAVVIEDGTAFASSVPLLTLIQHNSSDTGNCLAITNSGTSSNDISATNWTMSQAGLITKYDGTATVERGISSVVGHLNLTAQAAALSAHAFFTPAATGFYRISISAKVTTASGSAGVLGGTTGCTLAYTDGTDSVAQTAFGIALNSQAATPIVLGTGNTTLTTQAQSYGDAIIYAKTGVAVTISYGYTVGSGPAMAYAFRATAEAL